MWTQPNPVTLAAGASATVYPDPRLLALSGSNPDRAVLANSSPFPLTVGAGPASVVVPAWTAQMVTLSNPPMFTVTAFAASASFLAPPSDTSLYVSWLAPGEHAPGVYPQALSPNQAQSTLVDSVFLASGIATAASPAVVVTVTPPYRYNTLAVVIPMQTLNATGVLSVVGQQSQAVYYNNPTVAVGSLVKIPILVARSRLAGIRSGSDTSFIVTYIYNGNFPGDGQITVGIYGMGGASDVSIAGQPVNVNATAEERSTLRAWARLSTASAAQLIAPSGNGAGRRFYLTSAQLTIYTANGGLSTFSLNTSTTLGAGADRTLAAMPSNAANGNGHRELSWPNGFGLVSQAGLYACLDVLTTAFLGEAIVTYFEDF